MQPLQHNAETKMKPQNERNRCGMMWHILGKFHSLYFFVPSQCQSGSPYGDKSASQTMTPETLQRMTALRH